MLSNSDHLLRALVHEPDEYWLQLFDDEGMQLGQEVLWLGVGVRCGARGRVNKQGVTVIDVEDVQRNQDVSEQTTLQHGDQGAGSSQIRELPLQAADHGLRMQVLLRVASDQGAVIDAG